MYKNKDYSLEQNIIQNIQPTDYVPLKKDLYIFILNKPSSKISGIIWRQFASLSIAIISPLSCWLWAVGPQLLVWSVKARGISIEILTTHFPGSKDSRA